MANHEQLIPLMLNGIDSSQRMAFEAAIRLRPEYTFEPCNPVVQFLGYVHCFMSTIVRLSADIEAIMASLWTVISKYIGLGVPYLTSRFIMHKQLDNVALINSEIEYFRIRRIRGRLDNEDIDRD
jgi:hypothetical protein